MSSAKWHGTGIWATNSASTTPYNMDDDGDDTTIVVATTRYQWNRYFNGGTEYENRNYMILDAETIDTHDLWLTTCDGLNRDYKLRLWWQDGGGHRVPDDYPASQMEYTVRVQEFPVGAGASGDPLGDFDINEINHADDTDPPFSWTGRNAYTELVLQLPDSVLTSEDFGYGLGFVLETRYDSTEDLLNYCKVKGIRFECLPTTNPASYGPWFPAHAKKKKQAGSV